MRRVLVTVLASAFLCGAALAQAPQRGAPPPDQPGLGEPPPAEEPLSPPPPRERRGASPAETPPSLSDLPTDRKGRPRAKELRAACKADAQGLRGPDRKRAVRDCIAQRRPDLAKRMDCRRDAKSRGLTGAELKAAVKSCARS